MANLRPLKPCCYRGCVRLISGATYCPEHARQVQQQRGNSADRGYDRRWRAYRRQWLARHPLCGQREELATLSEAEGSGAEGPAILRRARQVTHSACAAAGRYTLATQVDHIVPVRGTDDPLFYEPLNHQSLCDFCHKSKTRKERS